VPTTLTESTINSISEFVQFAETKTDVHWYRGVGKHDESLKPSLYRHPTITDAAALLNLESDIIKRFRQRSIPYLSTPLPEGEGA
jgi:hypothetical protein